MLCVAITDAVVWNLTPALSVYDVIVVVGGGEAVMCTNSNNCDSLNAIASAPGFFTIVKSGRNSGGGKCRTQQKFCIGTVPFIRSFVCSFLHSFKPISAANSTQRKHIGFVRNHDEWVVFNARKIVRWCDEVISIDFLYFLKIYAL